MPNETIPTFTGHEESLEEREKRWEKEKQGLIADLQKTREEKRTEVASLQERLAQLEAAVTEADEPKKPEEEVNKLAQDPRGYIAEQTRAIQERLFAIERDIKIEKAKKWIAKKEGIDPDEVESKYGNDLARIGKERGLVNLDPELGIKSAYEIMLQEQKEKEQREKERSAQISSNTSEGVRGVPTATSSTYTVEQVMAMSDEEFDKHQSAINEAMRRGQIKTSG